MEPTETKVYTQCPSCGGEVWDNRERKKRGETKPNAPDFSCKNKEGCGWVLWPKREAKSPGGFPRFQVKVSTKWGEIVASNNEKEILVEDLKWIKENFVEPVSEPKEAK